MSVEPKSVLFVCIGNACRSQMAEGFARAYGSDVIAAASAGLHPAMNVASDTQRAMREKNIDLSGHFPKNVHHVLRTRFDLVINMSGLGLPARLNAPVRVWDVPDPVQMKYDDHCGVRNQIEHLVMMLILELRKKAKAPDFRGQGSGRLET